MKPFFHFLYKSAFAACLASSVVCFSTESSLHTKQRVDKILQFFPLSEEETAEYVASAMDDFDDSLDNFLSISPEERTFTNTIRGWDDLTSFYINNLILFRYIPIITKSENILASSIQAQEDLQDYLTTKIRTTPEIFQALFSYVNKALMTGNCPPSEWFYVDQVLQSIDSRAFPSPHKEQVEYIQSTSKALPKDIFTYLKGETGPSDSDKEEFTLINLNVCFMPHSLPLLFGGVLRWQERIDRLVDTLKEWDADIICLQEVFDKDSADLLFEGLKDRYAHFYSNIAAKNIGFSLESIGMGSGLFIASKFDVGNPTFTLFTHSMPQISRGFFDFTIHNRKGALAHIYTTHLEPFAAMPGPAYRTSQMQQMLEKIKEDVAMDPGKAMIPIVLCGDLNIDCGSSEEAEALVKEHFYDAYNDGRTDFSLAERTYIDFTDFWWKAKGDMEKFEKIPQFLDYALVLKKMSMEEESVLPGFANSHIQTKIVPMNHEDDPLGAMSDHHGQFTIIKRKTPEQ